MRVRECLGTDMIRRTWIIHTVLENRPGRERSSGHGPCAVPDLRYDASVMSKALALLSQSWGLTQTDQKSPARTATTSDHASACFSAQLPADPRLATACRRRLGGFRSGVVSSCPTF